MINITLKPTVVIVLIVTVALAYVAVANGPAPVRIGAVDDGRLEKLADALEEKRREHNVSGMVVVVVKDDEVIFLEGFGKADVEADTPVTERTVFAIGSATKAMTATLIGILVDEGVMDWDDPIRKYLPDFVIGDEETAEQVTIRDLLSHRTGLGRNDMLWASGQADRETILQKVARAELRRPFRSQFLYNNIGYLAAGEGAGRAADSTWDDLMQQRLFSAVGMKHATLTIEDAQADEHLAVGYHLPDDDGIRSPVPMRSVDGTAPAGAVNATALDMAQWLRFQLSRGEIDGQRLLSVETIEEMWSPQIELAPGIEYGLGWFVREWEGRTLVEHAGNIDGYASMVAMLPEENLGFALLMNVTGSALQSLAFSEIFGAFLHTDEDADPLMNPEELKAYVGEYEFTGFDRPVKAVVQDGRLALDIPGQTIYELRVPDEDGRWRFKFDSNIAVKFNKDEDDTVTGLTLYQSGMELEMPRVGFERPAEVSRDEVDPYLGIYRFEMMQQDVEVLIENGRLAVDIPDQMVYELHPPDEDGKWRFRVTNQIAVEFIRDDAGEVVEMVLHQNGMKFEMPKTADAGAPVGVAVKDLLERLGEAYGSEHLSELGPLRMTGTVDMVHQGIDGTALLILDGTERFYETIDLGIFGIITQAITPELAWTSVFEETPQVLRGRYRDQMALMNPLLLATNWRKTFDEINYLRREENDGRVEHILQVQLGESVHMNVHVDDESARVVRQTMRLMLPGMGVLPTTLELGDYRMVKGVAIPHRYTMDNEYAGKIIYQIDAVETDVELDEEIFTIPEASKDRPASDLAPMTPGRDEESGTE